MQNRSVHRWILILFTAIAAGALIFWLVKDPVHDFSRSIPGMDNRPLKDSVDKENIIIGEKFFRYAEFKSELKGSWTRFRGADFDNINKEKIPLIDSWNNEPRIKWTVPMGEGHAAPVISNGKVFVLDYDEIKKADALRCFALETGEELWKRSYNVHIKRNHGMSRTVPAIKDNYLVTIGPRGHVMCVDATNGDLLWGIDLVNEYQSELPFWYTGQCPIIDDNEVILAPGGNSLMIGVNLKTGQVVWKSPNPKNWKMSHSSIMPMVFNGKKMYVYAAVGGICGISAEKEDKGKILWENIDFSPNVVAPSPLVLNEGKIFMTAGYGAGAILLQISKQNQGYQAKTLRKYKPKDGLASEQQTPILYKNRVFGILPKDAGGMRNQFVCCNPDDFQNILWTSGQDERYGLGPYIIADDKFFILNDDGTLTIAKASIEKFEVLDKFQIIKGHDAWGPIAIADGYLIMRDAKNMICIDIKK